MRFMRSLMLSSACRKLRDRVGWFLYDVPVASRTAWVDESDGSGTAGHEGVRRHWYSLNGHPAESRTHSP